MTVAENIKSIINDRGLKQKTVGIKAGWEEKRFSLLLTGRMTFKADYLPAICMALDMSPDEVLSYKPNGKQQAAERRYLTTR